MRKLDFEQRTVTTYKFIRRDSSLFKVQLSHNTLARDRCNSVL